MPPEKLLGDGFSTPMPLFCLICTIISNKTYILDYYQKTNLNELGSILVHGFDTRLIPRSFSCGLYSYINPSEVGVLINIGQSLLRTEQKEYIYMYCLMLIFIYLYMQHLKSSEQQKKQFTCMYAYKHTCTACMIF